MPRLARVVIPDFPHHVTQRGNRNQRVFFSDADRRLYLQLVLEHSRKNGVDIWAYCLMDNHVHFIAVPHSASALALCFREAHKLYTRHINAREGWKGFLWQGRFFSCPMDERYLYAAVRYVERNPVAAGIVQRAEDYAWSSARAHVSGTADALLSPFFLQEEISSWSEFLQAPENPEAPEVPQTPEAIEKCVKSGRPFGSEDFVERLEGIVGRRLKRLKAGRKSNATAGVN